MVDVGDKAITERVAVAQSVMILEEEIIMQLLDDDIQTKKGPVFQTAILAGIMAAKKTSDLIPLCHPLPLTKVDITIEFNESKDLIINCLAKTHGQTGVEMEALTVEISALDERLADSETYSGDTNTLNRLLTEQGQLRGRLADIEASWLNRQEALEAAERNMQPNA